MPLIVKPDLSKVWASTGSKAAPPEVKIASGWGYEMMPFEWENWIQNRADTAISHINQRGIAEWDIGTEYQANRSYVTGSDGTVYKALTTNTNINPVTDSGVNWRVAFLSVGANGRIGIGATPLPNSTLTIAGNNTSLAFGVASSEGGHGEIFANSAITGWRANTYYNGADRASVNGYSPNIVMRLDDGSIRFHTSTNGTANAVVSLSERMRVDTSGNVGINTIPDATLHVDGTIRVAPVNPIPAFRGLVFAGTTADTFTVDSNKALHHCGLTAKTFSDVPGAPTVALAGYGGIRLYTTGVERLRITDSGNIGVGVVPATTMHLKSPANTTMQLTLDTTTSSNQNAVNFSLGGVSKGYIGVAGATDHLVTGTAPGDMAIRSDGGSIVFSTNSGVGAAGYFSGTTLNVTGGMTLGSNLLVNGATPTGSSGVSTRSVGATANGFSSVVDGFAATFVGVNNSGATIRGVPTGTVGFGTADSVPIVLGNANTEQLRLNPDGSVGLGVNPSVGYGKEITISDDTIAGVSGLGVRNWAVNDNELYLTNNAKNTGASSDAYWTSSQPATKYTQKSGDHSWYVAQAGTAGSPITWSKAMTLGNDGSLLMTGAGGIGYGVGSGGVVMQPTTPTVNKGNPVTINKLSGQIVLNAGVLYAGALGSSYGGAKFTVNNSMVGPYDVPIVAVTATGGDQTLLPYYTARVLHSKAGSFMVEVRNEFNQDMSATLTLNFIIMKGSNA